MATKSRTAPQINRALGQALREVVFGLKRIDPAIVSYPPLGLESLVSNRASPRLDGAIEFAFKPLILQCPERAIGRRRTLAVVLDGFLDVDVTARPALRGFGTRIAYFRVRQSQLVHVFGAHYDFDEHSPGHPIFHAQLASKASAYETLVRDALSLDQASIPLVDGMGSIIQGVRIPTAQLDIFSVLAQIAADQVLSPERLSSNRREFSGILKSCHLFFGGVDAYPRLRDSAACMRASHWYDV